MNRFTNFKRKIFSNLYSNNIAFIYHKRFKRNNVIAIDLTMECNNRCFNCEASCRQAPSNEIMTVDQIKKFVDEAIKLDYRWDAIKLRGGEPTLHPKIFEIIGKAVSFMPDIGIKDIELTFVPTSASVGEITKNYPVGLSMAGTMEVFGKQGTCDMRLITSGDDAGLRIKGKIDQIKLGPFEIYGAGEDKVHGTADDGVIVTTELSKNKQEMILSGFIKLGTEKVHTEVIIDKKGNLK